MWTEEARAAAAANRHKVATDVAQQHIQSVLQPMANAAMSSNANALAAQANNEAFNAKDSIAHKAWAASDAAYTQSRIAYAPNNRGSQFGIREQHRSAADAHFTASELHAKAGNAEQAAKHHAAFKEHENLVVANYHEPKE